MILSIVIIVKMTTIITPVTIIDIHSKIVNDLQANYGITKKMAEAIYKVHIISEYSPDFIAKLILSESSFNPDAKSPKGYKGILQTPTKTGYLKTDILHGIEILQSKFKQHKDPIDAIAAYKGGKDKPQARRQAIALLKAIKEI